MTKWLKNLIGDQEAKRLYLEEDLSTREIAERFQIDRTGVRKYLNRLGIEIKERKYKYHIDETFFKIPNNINCYIAGFTAADGSIMSNSNSGVAYSIKDREILEYIKKATQYTGPITEYQIIINNIKKTYFRLNLFGKNIVKDLCNNWNITPNKTITLQPPNLDLLEHKLAYICGYIDGDGCIRHNKRKNGSKQYTIQFCGSEYLMNWICNFTKNLLNHSCNVRKYKNKQCFEFKLSDKYAKELRNLVLNIDTGFKLKRKWEVQP